MSKLPKNVKAVWESHIKQFPESNKHISYSQLSSFATCPRQWYWNYVKGLAPYKTTIHTTFGTAMHETIQTWLEVLYHKTVKEADAMNLDLLLYQNLGRVYREEREKNGGEHFSSKEELTMFYLDGTHILDFLKKQRRAYFTTKRVFLAGVETLLYRELRPGVFFKGYIDLVFYDERIDRWTIMDIKTSTSGWNKYAKNDDKRKSQILLYKHFFSEQFDIPLDKIKVQYFILKRKVPVEAEYASMQRRVQEFNPVDGPIKMKQAYNLMENFVSNTIDTAGNYIQIEPDVTPSKDSCRFCIFKEKMLCSDAVL